VTAEDVGYTCNGLTDIENSHGMVIETMILISETSPYENKISISFSVQLNKSPQEQRTVEASPAGQGYRKCGGRKNRMIL
jgi:hypothetical protein